MLRQGARLPAQATALAAYNGVRVATRAASSQAPKAEKAVLRLADGSTFEGYRFGAARPITGEVVFNTGMVGYPESLTDPSYAGQILTMTYPLIGNYGVPKDANDVWGLSKHFESNKIHIQGLVVADYSHKQSHWNFGRSLDKWLKDHDVPAIYGVDTRQITKTLRSQGVMLGTISKPSEKLDFVDPNRENLIAAVSTKTVATYGPESPHAVNVTLVDCGVKNNIIRQLVERGARVTVVPWDYDFRGMNHDGLFLSNGPGDPTMAGKTIEHIAHSLKGSTPILGICMGNQLLGLAAGGKTYKLPFGNRGQNVPCIDQETFRCYITPQNHGFAIDSKSLPAEWKTYFVNANDGSNEGIKHLTKPFFSVQFHPEAEGGPYDTSFLFDYFLREARAAKKARIDSFRGSAPSKRHYSTAASGKRSGFIGGAVASSLANAGRHSLTKTTLHLPRAYHTGPHNRPKKVIVLGSGGLSIGQAGEFDYSGSQAIKAMKEEGIRTVLINPNIATVQTAKGLADKVYFLPVTAEFVEEVIKKEQPDGILLAFGGQTALNCGVDLFRKGVFKDYNMRVIGTSVETIIETEDRELFNRRLTEVEIPFAKSFATDKVPEALAAAELIGYPVMIRSAFALGGLGSGICRDKAELESMATKALASAPQILVERSMKGWKEVEYEVVRDSQDNCITVCNMENFDPMGIHTGDSIVCAPSQTLSNSEYHMLRSAAIKVIRHLGIVGECNIQYSLNPFSEEYAVIEVNARLSRSSALASKATGYPLAFIAAKLGLGIPLTHIKNAVTQSTIACFEPSLDYIVTKIPRWDLTKFERVDPHISSCMQSVGEVMSIGRSFEEGFQKALRMVDPGISGFESQQFTSVEDEIANPTPRRPFAIHKAMMAGMTADRVHELSKIDLWFLYKLENLIRLEKELSTLRIDQVSVDLMREVKQAGFADKQIAKFTKSDELTVRKHRIAQKVIPVVKQIDTLAAEFPAVTNYLYTTYNGTANDLEPGSDAIMVLGSGNYRIGSSVEFDYCGVSTVRTLRQLGYKTIMVNYNPETVSTDYDESDRLYFEELSLERVLDIYEREKPRGIVVSMGGQLPNNIALKLAKYGAKILGTSPESVDKCEDRNKFSKLMDELSIAQPAWKALTTPEDAFKFADKVTYPVLIRPSYVLSGAAMNVAHNKAELAEFLSLAKEVSEEYPVVITKFVENAREIEIDAVATNGNLVCRAISEHIENAGVHSGDATMVQPPVNTAPAVVDAVTEVGRKVAKALNISGPFNMQLLEKNGELQVIECNLRASRSFPFISKVLNVDFIAAAAKVFVNENVSDIPLNTNVGHVAVKCPQFSWQRLRGADPVLGVEMASTGEIACFGATVEEAYLKSFMSQTRLVMPKRNIFVSFSKLKEADQATFRQASQDLVDAGFTIYSTPDCAKWLMSQGVPCSTKARPNTARNAKDANILTGIASGEIEMVINVPSYDLLDRQEAVRQGRETDEYLIRRHAVDFNRPLINNLQLFSLFARAMNKREKLQVKSWEDYFPNSA